MAFKLKLFITGLCAIVRDNGDVVVVLPNARDFDHMGQPISPTNLPEQHIPMLCVPAQGWTSQRAGSFLIPAASNLAPSNLTAFPLDGEDLTVMPVQPSPAALAIGLLNGCPTDASASDFRWIANMAEVNATPRASLTAPAFPPTDLALARLRVTNGSWLTHNVAAGPVQPHDELHFLTWSYQDMMSGNPMPQSPDRAIADIVTVEIPIDDPARATFHSSAANADVVIDGGGNDVIAYLVNLPLTVLLGVQIGARQPETHFGHFYRLANPPAMPMWIPAPSNTCTPVGPGTQLIPHCPPAYFG